MEELSAKRGKTKQIIDRAEREVFVQVSERVGGGGGWRPSVERQDEMSRETFLDTNQRLTEYNRRRWIFCFGVGAWMRRAYMEPRE